MKIKIKTKNTLAAEARDSADNVIVSKNLNTADSIIDISDSTAVIKNSASTTIATDTIRATATKNIVVPDFTLIIKDQDNNVITSSQEPSGINITKTVDTTGGASGIHFLQPRGSQYQSFADEDDGWLIQNNFYASFEPINPAMIAKLDDAAGALYSWRMKENMTVGGVSNNLRYVDRDGGQIFPVSDNKDLTFIDKLTGLEWYRAYAPLPIAPASGNWIDSLAFARNHSVVIDSEVCNDWIIPTIQMLQTMIGSQAGLTIIDNGSVIWFGANYEVRSSSTYLLNTNNAWVKHGGGNGYSAAFTAAQKTDIGAIVLCRKATHLISI
jgi:hypothetical protein